MSNATNLREWATSKLSGCERPLAVEEHLKLWEGISEHCVVLNLDLRQREHIEGDYQTAVLRMMEGARKEPDFGRAGRRIAIDVLQHHANPGSWYYTSVASMSFIELTQSPTERQPLVLLHSGMAGDVAHYACGENHRGAHVAWRIAHSLMSEWVKLKTKPCGVIGFPCHPKQNADIDYLRAPILNPVERTCPECFRQWEFRRSEEDVIDGKSFDELTVANKGWGLPDLGIDPGILSRR